MASYNKVILVGNLTRDPDLRYTSKGTALAKIALAVNRSWKSETGEAREEVTFVDVDAFGRQAEVIAQYLKKGSPLLVEGRLKLDTWEDKQTNQKRSRLGVVLESFQFLDSRSSRGGDESAAATGPAAPRPQRSTPPSPPAASTGGTDAPEEPQGEDDVPF